jgi:hypothetical protein
MKTCKRCLKPKWIVKRLAQLDREMSKQVEIGMEKGWPVLFWDRNCVERETLRRVIGLRRKPFCAADTMAGW